MYHSGFNDSFAVQIVYRKIGWNEFDDISRFKSGVAKENPTLLVEWCLSGNLARHFVASNVVSNKTTHLACAALQQNVLVNTCLKTNCEERRKVLEGQPRSRGVLIFVITTDVCMLFIGPKLFFTTDQCVIMFHKDLIGKHNTNMKVFFQATVPMRQTTGTAHLKLSKKWERPSIRKTPAPWARIWSVRELWSYWLRLSNLFSSAQQVLWIVLLKIGSTTVRRKVQTRVPQKWPSSLFKHENFIRTDKIFMMRRALVTVSFCTQPHAALNLRICDSKAPPILCWDQWEGW